jgi:hypothetical protein
MFLLILQHYTKRDVIGVDISKLKEGEEKIDICIFIGDGSKRLKTSNVPKIHFTGEPKTEVLPYAQLSLGFDHTISDTYSRIQTE